MKKFNKGIDPKFAIKEIEHVSVAIQREEKVVFHNDFATVVVINGSVEVASAKAV